MNTIDLLSPHQMYKQNYAYQVRSTVEAYSSAMIVVGEALQNAMDAVCENKAGLSKGLITAHINFDTNTVEVTDNGVGFPSQTSLLYLGGSDKKGKMLKGKIGVGIKVAMFCSEYFCIQSNRSDGAWKLEIDNAFDFENLERLEIPADFPADPNPLPTKGTSVSYRFPDQPNQSDDVKYLDRFVREMVEAVLPRKTSGDFGVTLNSGNTNYPSAFAVMVVAFLRRYSYAGDVLNALGEQRRFPSNGIDIDFTITCSDPIVRFGRDIGELFGTQAAQTFSIQPRYLQVEDTIKWATKGKKVPKVFRDRLGNGGGNLEKTDGFNVLTFSSPEDYELLLVNKIGKLPTSVDDYRAKLFPHINGIMLTIGRIPDFEQYLPGGSRRVISCNGIVTSHEIDLTRGRNQEYVRCFDLVVDLNAELNYGKTHITNPHLVKLIRDYINEAYTRTIQNGAGNWVGKIPIPEEEETEVYTSRPDLGLANFTTRKQSRDENDVIGLFFELAGRGYFPQYRIFGLSQRDVYDCRAAIQREGDDPNVLNPSDDTRLRIVEFKVDAAEVIKDFDRTSKSPRDINLVIAWKVSDYDSKNYGVYDIDQSTAYKASPRRVFPNATKYIYDTKSGAEVQLLLLNEVVEGIKTGRILSHTST